MNHTKNEYVRGNVHTNNLESFWSLLKRGVIGTYHKVSKDCRSIWPNFRFAITTARTRTFLMQS
ncbi:MAG: hypothetical protein C4293_02175 [Nitrospiraceae bacterium]